MIDVDAEPDPPADWFKADIGMMCAVVERGCSFEGCSRPVRSGTECEMHATRRRRHGDPSVVLKAKNVPAIDRFLAKIEIDANGCWLWQGARTPNGYGQFWFGPDLKRGLAHRWSYTFFVGSIPPDRELDHLCRVRECCCPDHLEPVSRLQNVERGDGPRLSRERAALYAPPERCRRGHEMTEANTYTFRGYQKCRRCKADRQREYQQRKREA